MRDCCWTAMVVTLEALQVMMAELRKQNEENMATLAKQQFDALQLLVQRTKTTSGAMTGPITFQGEEGKYGEWMAKLLAYLRVTVSNSEL